jgi:hypothetical protein
MDQTMVMGCQRALASRQDRCRDPDPLHSGLRGIMFDFKWNFVCCLIRKFVPDG